MEGFSALSSTAMIVFWIYIIAMVGVGIYCRKYAGGFDNFMVGGRNLGPWYMGATFFATYMSSSVMIGNCGTAYRSGMSYMWNGTVQTLTVPIGIILVFAGLAKASKQLGAVTVPGYMRKRYLSKAPSAFLGCMMLIFLLPYLIGIAKGSANMLSAITGYSFSTCVYIILGCTAIYAVVGGFMAGTITDFWQAFIMCFAATFVFVAALSKAGGLSNVVSTLKAEDPILVNSPGTLGWGSLVGVTFVYGFAPWGLPQLIQKGFAMKDKRVIKSSIVVVGFLLLFILLTSNGNGAIARAIFGDQYLDKTDMVFPMLVVTLLPEWAQGLCLAGVCAAAMSTLDSVTLVMGGALANDIYKECINPNADDKTVLRISQATIFVVLALLALITAGGVGTEITFLATFSHAMMASMCFFPVFGGIYWKKGNVTGVLAAQILGVSTALIWYALGGGQTFHGIHFFFPAIIMSGVGYFCGSKFGKPLPEEYIKELFPSGSTKEFHWGTFNSKQAAAK